MSLGQSRCSVVSRRRSRSSESSQDCLKGCPVHAAGLPPRAGGPDVVRALGEAEIHSCTFSLHCFKPHGLNISKSDLQEFCFVLFYVFTFASEASGLHETHHCAQKLIPGHSSSLPLSYAGDVTAFERGLVCGFSAAGWSVVVSS